MSGGGGGGSQTSISKMEPAAEVKPYLNPYMTHAAALSMKPYEAYQGNRIADWTPDQLRGFQMTRDVANQANTAISNSANQLNRTLNGQYLNYSPGNNQYMGATTTVGKNAYAGPNPYLDKAIRSAQDDMTRQFNNNVQNSTDAMMARSGAFGGSAWRQAQQANQEVLNKQIGDVSTQMRMQDYGMQQQLAEADINRRLQSEQQDLARNAGLRQDQLNMLNSNWNNERQRQLQASQLIPSLTQGGYQNAQALLGIGDAIQGMNQDRLNMQYEDWLEKQNWDQRSLDIMGNAISRTMGAGGSTTNTGPNPNQRNRTASALGGALSGGAMGAGLFPAAAGATPWGALIGGGLGLVGGLL